MSQIFEAIIDPPNSGGYVRPVWHNVYKGKLWSWNKQTNSYQEYQSAVAKTVTRPVAAFQSGCLISTECPEVEEYVDSVSIVTPGTGVLAIYDDHGNDVASRLRYSKTVSASDAGSVISLSDQPVLFGRDVFVSLPTGGAIWVNLVDKYAPPTTVEGNLTYPMTASGPVFMGHAYVKQLRILNRGTAGNLAVYESYDGDSTMTESVRFPSTAFSSLTDGQVIQFSKYGPSRFFSMYLVVPTGAVVAVDTLPRL